VSLEPGARKTRSNVISTQWSNDRKKCKLNNFEKMQIDPVLTIATDVCLGGKTGGFEVENPMQSLLVFPLTKLAVGVE